MRNTKVTQPKRKEKNTTVVTTSQILADGSIMDLVAGPPGIPQPELLHWHQGKAKFGRCIEHNNRVYEAPAIAESWLNAVRLPERPREYGSNRELLADVAQVFAKHLLLPERESKRLAYFTTISWVADCLPVAPTVLIFGPDESRGIDVLRVLGCVCRHPLVLADFSPRFFGALPSQLQLTLLVDMQRSSANAQRLLRASTYPGVYLPCRGGVVSLYTPKAIFCGSEIEIDMGKRAMEVTVTPSSSISGIGRPVEDQIARKFQSRLLMYRLKNLASVRDATINLSKFEAATGPIARNLAACFPEDLKLATEIVELLGMQETEARAQRFLSVNYVIIEFLLARLRTEPQEPVRVNELAKDVNTLLRSRGEIKEYSAEEVGWRLRAMGIPRHTSSSGQQVILDRALSEKVHDLARAYELPVPTEVESNGSRDINGQVLDKQNLM